MPVWTLETPLDEVLPREYSIDAPQKREAMSDLYPWTFIEAGGSIINSKYWEHEGKLLPSAWWEDRDVAEAWAIHATQKTGQCHCAVPVPYTGKM